MIQNHNRNFQTITNFDCGIHFIAVSIIVYQTVKYVVISIKWVMCRHSVIICTDLDKLNFEPALILS